MTFEKLNIPNGQSSLAGLVLYQFGPLKSKKISDCHQSVFYIKNSIFLILTK